MDVNAFVLHAIVFAGWVHGCVSMGEWVALKLVELDPKVIGSDTLLASMYIKMEEAGKVWVKEMGVGRNSWLRFHYGEWYCLWVREEIHACLLQGVHAHSTMLRYVNNILNKLCSVEMIIKKAKGQVFLFKK